jgi:hypothetical protein
VRSAWAISRATHEDFQELGVMTGTNARQLSILSQMTRTQAMP